MSDTKLDAEAKTGDLPVAETDHTQKTSVKSADAILAQQVEQRFRKPKETEATEQASPSEPVEPRIEADGGVSVDDALSFADDVAAAWEGREPSPDDAYTLALAAEVRRLRAVIQQEHGVHVSWVYEVRRLRARHIEMLAKMQMEHLDVRAEVRRLREEAVLLNDLIKDRDENALDDARAEVAEGVVALEGTCRDLSVKLARVEALPRRWREIQPPFGGSEGYAKRCVFEQLTTELEAALRDEPQPTVSLASEEDGGDVDAIALNPLREPKLPFNGY